MDNTRMRDALDYVDKHTSYTPWNYLKPDHTTQASKLSCAVVEGKYPEMQFLEWTFSILVQHNGAVKPIVMTTDEGILDISVVFE